MAQINALTPEGRLPSAAQEHVREMVPHPLQGIDTATDWVQAEVDETGQIARAIDKQGRTWFLPHPDVPGILDPEFASSMRVIQTEEWAWALADPAGQVGLGLRWDGTAYPAGGSEPEPYDVILLVGQSNMKGAGYPMMGRDPWPGIDQFPAATKPAHGTVIPAAEPLQHQGPVQETQTGLGIPFARAYRHEHPGRRVLLVPAAWGATGFSSSPNTWDWTAPDDGTNLAANAVRQAQDALAAAGGGARLAGILWHQGESDTSIAAEYATKLDGLIAYFRAELNAPNVPFVVGQMSPDRQGGGNAVIIDLAHQQTPARVERTAFAPSPPGLHNPGDPTHLSTRALDIIGPRFEEALRRAAFNAPRAPIGPENVTARRSGDTVTVAWDAAWCRVADYRVEWREPSGTWATTGVNHAPPLALDATFTAPTGAVEVRVTTINADGESTPVTTTV